MFFVYEEGLTTKFVVGGASSSTSAKQLAENRAKQALVWREIGAGYEAVMDCVTYQIIYRIVKQEER